MKREGGLAAEAEMPVPGELAKGRRWHRRPEARLGRDRARVSTRGWGSGPFPFTPDVR